MAASLAEPGQRLLARVVDTLVVGVPVIVVVRGLVSGHTVDVVAPPAVAGCMLLYEAIQLALWGRTLGKRFAGIEVVAALPDEQSRGADAQAADAEAPGAEAAGGTAKGGAGGMPVSVPGFRPVSVPGFVPVARREEAEAEPEETDAERGVEVGSHPGSHPGARLGVLQAVLRAAVYSLPIAARPIPVLGLLASVFWVVNAGFMFEGTQRQAVHDRLAGTLVVKRARP